MDVIRSTVALRERDLLDVMDLTIRFAAEHARALGLASLACMLPGFVIALAVLQLGSPVAAWLFALAWITIASAPISALASRLVFDERATVSEGLTRGARALGAIAKVRVVQGVVMALASVLVVAPVLVHAAWMYAPEVAMLEGSSTFASLGRSARVASRSTGESVLVALVLGAVTISSAPLGDHVLRTTMTELLGATAPASIFERGCTPFGLAGFFFAAPVVTLARFFFYLNARTRAEGWDVQTRFVAIAQRQSG